MIFCVMINMQELVQKIRFEYYFFCELKFLQNFFQIPGLSAFKIPLCALYEYMTRSFVFIFSTSRKTLYTWLNTLFMTAEFVWADSTMSLKFIVLFKWLRFNILTSLLGSDKNEWIWNFSLGGVVIIFFFPDHRNRNADTIYVT